MMFVPTAVLNQFVAAMERRGLVPPKQIIADGEIHRCNVKFKKGRGRGDGAYLVHPDGVIPGGGLENWTDGRGWENWKYDPGRELSAAEREEVSRKSTAAAKARQDAKKHDQEQARQKAARLWQSAQPCPDDHPYLIKKGGIKAHGARVLYGRVVVPVRDIDGEIHSLQFIYADGVKRFMLGGRVRGCMHRIDGDSGRIVIAEGFATTVSVHEATGATVIAAFDAGNLMPVAEAVRKQSPDVDIVIGADDDWKRKDGNIGIAKATEAARAIGAKLAVPNFRVNRRDRDTDFNDLASFIGPDAVKRCIDEAVAPEGIDAEAEYARLAKLSTIEYERVREATAKRFGMRVSVLDEEVERRRDKRAKASQDNSDPAHWAVKPWSDAVDGAVLLDEIAKMFSRHVILPRCGADALALWVLHAWAFDAADVSPFAHLTSPEKRCGKTTVLIILQYLTPRSELAGNISPAAIFRYIEQRRPTLLIDEGDTFVNDADEIRGILNTGHTKTSANVIRAVEANGDFVAKRFSTWAPKAIASIGKIADTLADRSITIVMQRRARDQKVERLRRRDNAEFTRLRSMALRWSQDKIPVLLDADAIDATRVPAELNDRAADNWRFLLAIADAAGGKWPERARTAALALSGAEAVNSTGVQLLRDIRDAFRRRDEQGNVVLDLKEIKTEDLLAHLTVDPERPWAEYRRGKPLSAKQLGALLGKFGIASEKVQGVRGYKQARFEDAWARYLPPDFGPNVSGDPGVDPLFGPLGGFKASKRPKDDETGVSPTFQSVPDDGSGRIENSEKVPSTQPLGHMDGSKPRNGPESMKAVGNGPSTVAERGGRANAAGGAPDDAGSAAPDGQGHPRCAWCGQSDRVLITRRAIGPDGVQHVGTVHVECGPAWERMVKTGKRRGATKATTKWQGQL